jgi:AAA15 family ATPase/GTPase
MLLEMSVTNFRSFAKTQTFSLIAHKAKELEDTNTFTVSTPHESFRLLSSAAIYGPNAGGKSNFLLAVKTVEELVLHSAGDSQRGEPIDVMPFRLSALARTKPSEFELTFIVNDVRYQYGFAATTDQIHEEWLFAYPKGRAQRWFSRAWSEEKQDYEWEFSTYLTGEKLLWKKTTRSNALFLSTAVQLNSEQLQPIFDWFANTLRLASERGWGRGFTAAQCEKFEGKTKVLNFLKAADIHIEDIEIEKKPFDQNDLPQDMPTAMREELANQLKNTKRLEIRTVHKDDEGNPITFEFEDESDGTRKLFAFAGPWLDALENGYVLFIDELHNNLHPKLVQFLVDLFHNKETNPNKAQLVFTTHETSILNQETFRRDQIWFCEKTEMQASELFPLTDFSPLKGRENLELSYLSGRYGAVPFVSNI